MPPRNADIRSFFSASQAQSSQRQQSSSRPPASQTPTPGPESAAVPDQAAVPNRSPVQSRGKVVSPPPVSPLSAVPEISSTPSADRTLTPDRTLRSPRPRSPHSPSPAFRSYDNDFISPKNKTYSITSSPPSIAPRRTFDADAVIGDSDDGDDDLESSDLEDIMAPVRRQVVEEDTPRARMQTPQVKRTAKAIQYNGVPFSSPLSIRKKHKYDINALARLNERDVEALEGEERVRQLEEEALKRDRLDAGETLEEVKNNDKEGTADVEEGNELRAVNELKQQLLDSVPAADDDDDGGRAKRVRMARAIERAADVSLTGRKTFYFFEQTERDTEASIVGNAFPVAKAKGPWKILADKKDRARHFQSGLPYDIQMMFGNLPDEIFLWVLNEVCQERRTDLAGQYMKLLRICPDQVQRLVTPTLLQGLFRNLGATKDICTLKATVVLTDELSDPYRNRSWTCLENFLSLLGCIAGSLESTARTMAMQTLLRLGMDKVAVESFGLTQEWRWTVDILARSVPGEEWANFCQEVCASLYQSTEKSTLRYKAINLLGPVQRPESPPDLQRRTLDLKRRLASVFFFDEPRRADKEPEDTVNIRAIIDRLDDPPYIFDPKNPEMDFREFAASMLLLNIALGDAAKQQTVVARASGEQFDAEVDELAASVKAMSARVNVVGDGIRVSRIEAKNALDIIYDRLLFQLRTKPVRSKLGIEAETDDLILPNQQAFMAKFVQKRMDKARPSIETEGIAV